MDKRTVVPLLGCSKGRETHIVIPFTHDYRDRTSEIHLVRDGKMGAALPARFVRLDLFFSLSKKNRDWLQVLSIYKIKLWRDGERERETPPRRRWWRATAKIMETSIAVNNSRSAPDEQKTLVRTNIIFRSVEQLLEIGEMSIIYI